MVRRRIPQNSFSRLGARPLTPINKEVLTRFFTKRYNSPSSIVLNFRTIEILDSPVQMFGRGWRLSLLEYWCRYKSDKEESKTIMRKSAGSFFALNCKTILSLGLFLGLTIMGLSSSPTSAQNRLARGHLLIAF